VEWTRGGCKCISLSLSHHPSASWARARLLHYGIDTDGCGGGFKLLATLTTAPPDAILELDHQREIDFYTARGHLHNSYSDDEFGLSIFPRRPAVVLRANRISGPTVTSVSRFPPRKRGCTFTRKGLRKQTAAGFSIFRRKSERRVSF